MDTKEKLKKAHHLILEAIRENASSEQASKLMDEVVDPLEEIIRQW